MYTARLLAILLMLTFTTVNALADSCSSIDLRPALGAPRDQGDTGWCFSHTAADLLSVKLKKRISAYDLAISHHLADLKKLENSPHAEVREHLRQNNLIPRIRDERIGESDDPGAPYVQAKNFFRVSKANGETTHKGLIGMGGSEDVAILMGQERGFCLADQLEGQRSDADFLRRIKGYHQSRGREPLGRGFHDYGIASEPEAQRMAESVIKYADLRCQPRIRPREPIVPYIRMYGKGVQDFRKQVKAGTIDKTQAQKNVWGDIDKLLEQGEATTIGYDAYDISPPDAGAQHGDHSSVIAGRKMMNGQCHYFLRNSWGKDCSIYTAKFKSRCDKNAGGVWLKKSELPSLYSVVSLSKPRDNSFAPASNEAPETDARD
ncbi:MAG: hypothetical protein KF767_14315 [Bdellovibrionaceae bacterium]|nr:hypothetical protein [Pseudobdellovibrionaceae bacterium]